MSGQRLSRGREADRVQVGPLDVHRCTERWLLDNFSERINGKIGGVITYAHLHTLSCAIRDPEFATSITDCDLCYCDGIGVSYISLRLNMKWLPKVTANSFIGAFRDRAIEFHWKVALIGSRPDVLSRAALFFNQEAICVAYTHHGYFDDPKMQTLLERDLIELKPDLIIVGLGQSLQERWALGFKAKLPGTLFLCAGNLFAYLAGEEWRCRKWVRKLGFEWILRLMRDPRRLWRRYLIDGPRIIITAVFKGRLNDWTKMHGRPHPANIFTNW